MPDRRCLVTSLLAGFTLISLIATGCSLGPDRPSISSESPALRPIEEREILPTTTPTPQVAPPTATATATPSAVSSQSTPPPSSTPAPESIAAPAGAAATDTGVALTAAAAPLFHAYEVQAGDSIASIAERYGIAVDSLIESNLDALSVDGVLVAGVMLRIPATDGVLHTVGADESLWTIAQTYETSVNAIIALPLHQIGDPNLVVAGMTILIPAATSGVSNAAVLAADVATPAPTPVTTKEPTVDEAPANTTPGPTPVAPTTTPAPLFVPPAPSPTATSTPIPRPTVVATPTPTPTRIATSTPTSTPTATPVATRTATPTATVEPPRDTVATSAVTPTATPKATATPTPVATPAPTVKPATAQPTATATSTATSTVVPKPVPTPIPSVSLDAALAASPWPKDLWPTVKRIVQCESGGDVTAVGPGGHRGLMQVDPQLHGPVPADAVGQLTQAYDVYLEQGWGAWTCY